MRRLWVSISRSLLAVDQVKASGRERELFSFSEVGRHDRYWQVWGGTFCEDKRSSQWGSRPSQVDGEHDLARSDPSGEPNAERGSANWRARVPKNKRYESEKSEADVGFVLRMLWSMQKLIGLWMPEHGLLGEYLTSGGLQILRRLGWAVFRIRVINCTSSPIARFGVKVCKIMPGSLSLSAGLLERVDWTFGNVHSHGNRLCELSCGGCRWRVNICQKFEAAKRMTLYIFQYKVTWVLEKRGLHIKLVFCVQAGPPLDLSFWSFLTTVHSGKNFQNFGQA